MSHLLKNYEIAKEYYAEWGIDTDAAIKAASGIPISVHCWQLDDIGGFENPSGPLTGGIATFGNAPGKPQGIQEFRKHMDKVLGLIPGAKKVALHAIYLDAPGIERNRILPEHFDSWIDYAQIHNIGLDFNPTYFSHEYSASGWTLSSPEKHIRDFWIEHGIQSRKIAGYIGKNLGQVCVNNHWIPDGSKEFPIDAVAPRQRLIESLDKIFAESIDPGYTRDAVESKLFGLGSESYTTGSHEFYINYAAARRNCLLTLDAGHFHPTESIVPKISSFLAFKQDILLHVSRPVRWDSDHVVLFDDETRALMTEIARHDAFGNVFIGLDFFDASINRITATAIGARNTKKSILYALLQPHKYLKNLEASGDRTAVLSMAEELKSLPFGFVWDMFCEQNNAPGHLWYKTMG